MFFVFLAKCSNLAKFTQANNCPICRAPFRALLQIRAVQKSVSSALNIAPQQDVCDEVQYKLVSRKKLIFSLPLG